MRDTIYTKRYKSCVPAIWQYVDDDVHIHNIAAQDRRYLHGAFGVLLLKAAQKIAGVAAARQRHLHQLPP